MWSLSLCNLREESFTKCGLCRVIEISQADPAGYRRAKFERIEVFIEAILTPVPQSAELRAIHLMLTGRDEFLFTFGTAAVFGGLLYFLTNHGTHDKRVPRLRQELSGTQLPPP